MNRSTAFRRHLCLLDVGHGNCAVLIAGKTDVVVLDAGRRGSLAQFLFEQEITHIRSIYLSHSDADHIGGLIGILTAKEVSIDRVYLNSDSSKPSLIWEDLVYALSRAHERQELEFKIGLAAGHIEELVGGVTVEVLGPSQYLAAKGPGSNYHSAKKIDSNSVSAIISVSVGDTRIALLPADVDGIGLEDLLNTGRDLSAQVLVYPHHGGQPGSGTSSEEFGKKLLSAVKPRLVVFSIGREMYSNPNPDTVRVLRKILPDARIACTQLSKHCAVESVGHSGSHLASAFARGKQRHECCAGTIIVPLDDPSAPQPQAESHMDFIQSHAPTALCLCPISEESKL